MIEEHLKQLQALPLSDFQKKYFAFLIEKGLKYDTLVQNIPNPRFEVHEKACFKNAIFGVRNNTLRYVEGFYLPKGLFPMEHAFNLNKKGEIVDFTTDKFNIEVTQRFGVEVPQNILEEHLESEQYLTPLQFYFEQINS